jgi:hypothetical protein
MFRQRTVIGTIRAAPDDQRRQRQQQQVHRQRRASLATRVSIASTWMMAKPNAASGVGRPGRAAPAPPKTRCSTSCGRRRLC